MIPEAQLFTGKDLTFPIEQDNSNIRHCLARFRRRTKVVSRCRTMVDLSLRLRTTCNSPQPSPHTHKNSQLSLVRTLSFRSHRDEQLVHRSPQRSRSRADPLDHRLTRSPTPTVESVGGNDPSRDYAKSRVLDSRLDPVPRTRGPGWRACATSRTPRCAPPTRPSDREAVQNGHLRQKPNLLVTCALPRFGDPSCLLTLRRPARLARGAVELDCAGDRDRHF